MATELNDILETACNYTVQGKACTNVFHWICTGASAEDDFDILEAINDAVRTRIGTSLLPLLSEDVVYSSIISRKVNPIGNVALAGYWTSSNVGEVTEDSVPQLAALVVSKYGTGAGKSYRGRYYQAGIPELQCNSGVLDATSGAAWTTAMGALWADLSLSANGTYTAGVYSRLLNAASSLSALVVRPALGHISRRRPKNVPFDT